MTIVSALEARGVELIRIGESKYKLCCPAHEDTRPSAVVNFFNGKWRVHCFVCGFDEGEVGLLVALGMTMREAHVALERPNGERPVAPPTPPPPPCSCDAPFGCQACTYAPPRSKGLVLCCCKCGLETDPRYTSCWELSSDGIADICPACCEGFPVHVDTRDRRTMAYEHALQLARCVALGDVQMLPHLASMLDLMEST